MYNKKQYYFETETKLIDLNYKTQKIELKVERAYLNNNEPFICLYVNGKFLKCESVSDCIIKRKAKKWLKETLAVKEFQDRYRKAQIKLRRKNGLAS